MDAIDSILRDNNPLANIYDLEFEDNFIKFCSFMCIVNNKKINLANIFLLILKDKNIRDLYKSLIDIEDDYEVCLKFLEADPSMYKSKYIRNYLDSVSGCPLK